MRVIILGMGVQGQKRRRIAGQECVGLVDPVHPDAGYRSVEEVPPDVYDAALVCIPDEPKVAVLEYLLEHGKHALVEKPLVASSSQVLRKLEELARSKRAVCYTAYNHRFEPHFLRMRELVRSGELGRLYHCRMFYGNGCARDVRESPWRDQGGGVIPDLGSHLLDTARFWFGELADDFEFVTADRFENRSPDHAVFVSKASEPRLELEMSLVSWRNDFSCDLYAERGSAHIRSLCKWGPSSFILRKRVLPSGRPIEEDVTLVSDDPTWELEYGHFKRLCEEREPADLSGDLWLDRVLRQLSEGAGGR